MAGIRPPTLLTLSIGGLGLLLLLLCSLYVDVLRDDRTLSLRTVDLGDVPQDEAIIHDFVIRNTTNRPITVTKIFKTCHCQYLELSEGATIPPGDELTFTFSIPTPEPGVQMAKAVVTTDSADDLFDKMVFTLRANANPTLDSSHSGLTTASNHPRT